MQTLSNRKGIQNCNTLNPFSSSFRRIVVFSYRESLTSSETSKVTVRTVFDRNIVVRVCQKTNRPQFSIAKKLIDHRNDVINDQN